VIEVLKPSLSSIPVRVWTAVVLAVAGVGALALPRGHYTGSRPSETPVSIAPGVGTPGGPPSSTDGLRGRVAEMEERLRTNPDDTAASVSLADALLRQARATGDSRPAGRAATVLERALREAPGTYDALRLLGAVQLSLHRFSDALDAGKRARDMRPDDAWNYGVMGDAQLELGDYQEAFASFEGMMRLRPGPTAYARIAYARELTGNLAGALTAMEMAYSATSSQDPEARAWYATQLGELELKLGRPVDAERRFREALYTFPAYPLAMIGAGKVKVAMGEPDRALAIYVDQFSRTPTLDLASRIGDLHRDAGRSGQAEHFYVLAEDLAGPIPAQTEATLALFLAEHDRKLDVALDVARRVAERRHDIVTEHALAWTYYKLGRINDASAAMKRALRTGSRDDLLLSHAALIQRDANTGLVLVDHKEQRSGAYGLR